MTVRRCYARCARFIRRSQATVESTEMKSPRCSLYIARSTGMAEPHVRGHLSFEVRRGDCDMLSEPGHVECARIDSGVVRELVAGPVNAPSRLLFAGRLKPRVLESLRAGVALPEMVSHRDYLPN